MISMICFIISIGFGILIPLVKSDDLRKVMFVFWFIFVTIGWICCFAGK